MKFDRLRSRIVLALLSIFVCASAQAQTLQSPEQFLGFRVGTDKKVATWPQVVQYMKMASERSDRIRFEELGKTTMGNPFILLTISSPKNLARLEEIRADHKKLAYPYTLEPGEAEKIIARDPAVMPITMSIHSTELGSTQMSLELVHRLATEKSSYLDRILDNVVFLLAPSVNPDGQVMVIDWYNKNVGTEFEFAPMPWLYHKYTGHDDNRDSYMLTQVESRYTAKLLYKDWFPVVFLDEHQMGSIGARIFVPPFTDPINPNIDPAVIAASNLLGMRMFTDLNAAGYDGVVYDQTYNWWWQGSAKNGAWYHNMAGLLTEVASARVASPIEQQRARLGLSPRPQFEGFQEGAGAGGGGDPRRPLAAPTDTFPRTNYPRPWLGGTWTLRNIVDYELVITWALLDEVAANNRTLTRNFYNLNRKSIEAGKRGDPFAYVIPPEQHDPGAVAKMLEVLDLSGIEIYRASGFFNADGKDYPVGTWVIPMAQPFRNYVKDLLEPQHYPMKPAAPGQIPERPYDVTGWTLPLTMGVNGTTVAKSFDTKLDRVSSIPSPEGDMPFTSMTNSSPDRTKNFQFLFPHNWNSSAVATNNLLKEGIEVEWATAEFSTNTNQFPIGTIIARGTGKEFLGKISRVSKKSHVRIIEINNTFKVSTTKLRPPRIALYQSWTASMDEGWTRWLLEQYEFPYTTVHNADIRAGKLNDKFDAIIFASQSRASILNGTRGEFQRPEYRGGLGEEGSKAIEEFVQAGGTLITLDEAADFAIDALGLPVRNVLRDVSRDKFYCPGAVLQILVDTQNPLAYGMEAKTSAYFLNSPAFEITAPFTSSNARVLARYPGTNALQSGWIGGPEYLFDKAGAVEVLHGKGRVVLLGFRAQFRGQPQATYKLLFNALHLSAAEKK
ncbi:MAG: hypothetical protein HY046_04585 [Acidobacteria bacterium]|nr:hypothetical protein [Acidobacteriota bacterium]